MQNKRNESTSVHGNQTMNLSVPVLHPRLWPPPHEMLWCHMVDISFLDSLRDVRRSESQTVMFSQNGRPLFLTFFLVFSASHTKNHTLIMVEINCRLRWWKIESQHLNKKYDIDSSILPDCAVILPKPPSNSVGNPIPVKFLLAHQIFKISSSLKLIN
jgi:hypothetical protein